MKVLAFAIAFAALLFAPIADEAKALLGFYLFLASLIFSVTDG